MTEPNNAPYKMYWDSCLFISIIEADTDRSPVLESIIDEADKGDVEIYTSIISIAEVSFGKAEKDGKVLDPSVEAAIEKLWLPSSPFKLAEMYRSLMFDAKSLMRQVHGDHSWSLKPADAIHLATANRIGVDVLCTYDDKLHRFAEILSFKVEEPKTDSFVWKDSDPNSE